MCSLDRMATDAIEDGGKKPVEIKFSRNPDGNKWSIIQRWDGTSFVAIVPSIQSDRKSGIEM